MKIKPLLEALVNFYQGNFGVGHTTAVMDGAASVPKCLVLAATQNQVQILLGRAKEAGADGVSVASVSDPDMISKLLGRKNTAIAFDNDALVQLFGAALEEIDRQERRVNHLKRLIAELADEAKDI